MRSLCDSKYFYEGSKIFRIDQCVGLKSIRSTFHDVWYPMKMLSLNTFVWCRMYLYTGKGSCLFRLVLKRSGTPFILINYIFNDFERLIFVTFQIFILKNVVGFGIVELQKKEEKCCLINERVYANFMIVACLFLRLLVLCVLRWCHSNGRRREWKTFEIHGGAERCVNLNSLFKHTVVDVRRISSPETVNIRKKLNC